MSKQRILIVRFSAFGDICQSLFAAEQLKDHFEIDYVTRSDFHTFLEEFSDIHQIFSLDRKKGLLGLITLALKLRKQNYDIIYDAHSNLRSHILSFVICFGKVTQLIRRSKERLQFWMLFKYKKSNLPNPYKGGDSYIRPIRHLFNDFTETPLQFEKKPIVEDAKRFKPYILLSPFASWPQKMLPDEQWLKFFGLHPNRKFIVVGGPDDNLPQSVIERYGHQILDLTGKAKWVPTLHLVDEAEAIVGVDTGVTHVGDLLGKPSYFFIGPSAIGYPTRQSSKTLEVKLPCKPCSKDGRAPCKNSEKLKCMKLIPVEEVSL